MFRLLRHSTNVLRIRQFSKRKSSSLAAAHSSWFKIEDEGMKEFELLARGSGFFIRGATTGAIIAIVSAHVAAPHRFPRYFPQEWLKHVRDADCETRIEKRSADGKSINAVIAKIQLAQGFRHSALDVAGFVLDNELASDLNIPVLELAGESDICDVDGEVTISGYRLIGASGSGSEAVVACEMNGTVSQRVKERIFINTGETETEMGMCGGPIVKSGDRDVCIGILEGLVPRVKPGATQVHEMHRKIGGHSVVISSGELRKFVHDVETEHARKENAKAEKL